MAPTAILKFTHTLFLGLSSQLSSLIPPNLCVFLRLHPWNFGFSPELDMHQQKIKETVNSIFFIVRVVTEDTVGITFPYKHFIKS